MDFTIFEEALSYYVDNKEWAKWVSDELKINPGINVKKFKCTKRLYYHE